MAKSLFSSLVDFTAPAVILMIRYQHKISIEKFTGEYGLVAEHETQETGQDRGNRPGSIPPKTAIIINKLISAFKAQLVLDVRARMANPKTVRHI